jgi:hypothetical protein
VIIGVFEQVRRVCSRLAAFYRSSINRLRWKIPRKSSTWTPCLPWQDSNRQMSNLNLAFEMWPEFRTIFERTATGDLSRFSRQKRHTHLPAELAARVAGFEPVSGPDLLRVGCLEL